MTPADLDALARKLAPIVARILEQRPHDQADLLKAVESQDPKEIARYFAEKRRLTRHG